jgi:EAL and modified HD-GYP domain-containing signal transduction protein
MESVYLGRQPIIDRESNLYAYEILYENDEKRSSGGLDRYTSASVISSVLNKFGTRNLLGDRRAFVKIDEKFLLSDIIFSIPKEFFIFSLLESVEMTPRVIERLEHLYKDGYKISIDDTILTQETLEKYQNVLKYISHIKIRIDTNISVGIEGMIKTLKANNVKVVAVQIEDSKQYVIAKTLGCEYFQGYFFAEPKIVENAKYEPSHLNILKLYNLLLQDTNIDEITKEFENNYEITLQLLQFINSGAFHFRKKISSIHHILTLMGRMPLAKWLMLMIYSKSVSKGGGHSPVMLLVKNRTELMENILKTLQPNVKSNLLGEAYFVGVLSLIDTIFSEKLETILEDMYVSEEVKNALLKDEGILGEIYALIRDIEAFNTHAISKFEATYYLEPGVLKKLILDSMENVNKFENPTLFED